MEEAILLVQGLNRSTGRNVGVYPELKAPAWHAREGKDPGRALLALLARHGYTDAAHAAFVQCFEPAELRRLRFELKTPLKLVQLLGTREEDGIDYPAMLTPEGLRKIASYAQGIGPHLSQVVDTDGAASRPRVNPLVADAHALGLVVHPYTFRRDDLPPGVANIEALLAFFVRQARVDGLFIDQPDAAVNFLCR
jgi:glycerophosphoryl diester phosphodiesterase